MARVPIKITIKQPMNKKMFVLDYTVQQTDFLNTVHFIKFILGILK